MLQDKPLVTKGRYRVRIACSAQDIDAAQALRALAFKTTREGDSFDIKCSHFLVHDRESNTLVCCFRMLSLASGQEIDSSYSAQYYDLSALEQFPGRMVELGRFCVHPDWADPDILRAAWGAMTAYVDDNQVQMLFGCSSFEGTETSKYLDAFAMLKARNLAPEHRSPQIKAPDVFAYAAQLQRKPNAKKAMRQMPPLLRTYLLMGGWVSDHAVIDHQLNTLHVFTGLEISAIPATRKRLLRAVATCSDSGR